MKAWTTASMSGSAVKAEGVCHASRRTEAGDDPARRRQGHNRIGRYRTDGLLPWRRLVDNRGGEAHDLRADCNFVLT